MSSRPGRSTRGVITGTAIPGRSGVTLLARLRGNLGALITQASLTSIAYTVTDRTAGTAIGTGTFTIASAIYDALQVGDARWYADTAQQPSAVDKSTGFNFSATLPATLFPLRDVEAESIHDGFQPRGRRMRCDVLFTPVSGELWRVCFEWEEVPVYG